jgi:hypothetical protein
MVEEKSAEEKVEENTEKKVEKKTHKPYKRNAKVIAVTVYNKNLCNISVTCRELNISRQTWYNWRTEDKDFDRECKEREASIIDMAETQLIANVNKGIQRAIEYILAHKHPDYKDKPIDIKMSGEIKNKISLEGMTIEQLRDLNRRIKIEDEDKGEIGNQEERNS